MKRSILSVLLLFLAVAGFAQTITVSGVVKDAATGETVIGAGVLVKETGNGSRLRADVPIR